jgi:hypothetical protein
MSFCRLAKILVVRKVFRQQLVRCACGSSFLGFRRSENDMYNMISVVEILMFQVLVANSMLGALVVAPNIIQYLVCRFSYGSTLLSRLHQRSFVIDSILVNSSLFTRATLWSLVVAAEHRFPTCSSLFSSSEYEINHNNGTLEERISGKKQIFLQVDIDSACRKKIERCWLQVDRDSCSCRRFVACQDSRIKLGETRRGLLCLELPICL